MIYLFNILAHIYRGYGRNHTPQIFGAPQLTTALDVAKVEAQIEFLTGSASGAACAVEAHNGAPYVSICAMVNTVFIFPLKGILIGINMDFIGY